MSHTKMTAKPPSRIGLLRLTPIMAALLAAAPTWAPAATVAPIKATAKYDKTLGVVVVSGTTAKTIAANSKITAFDSSNHVILYTINTNSTGKFKMSLPVTGSDYIPCAVRLDVTNAADNSELKTLVAVSGAASSCATVPTCAIATPAKDTEIFAGATLNFTASINIPKKGTAPSLVWSINDGAADQKTNTANHKFDQVGRYRVVLKGIDTAGNKVCNDDVVVSVIPAAGTNPNGKVPELAKPKVASAMPGANGANDNGAYVVLPFEETGMQGGSQVHLPYASMINYNALNAQVIQKLPNKPPILANNSIEVTYSAASNDKDPIAPNSINSTSQNLFGSNVVGANWDKAATVFNPTSKAPVKVKLMAEQNYSKAKIRKTEHWDRIDQAFNRAKEAEYKALAADKKLENLTALSAADKTALFSQNIPSAAEITAFNAQTDAQKATTLNGLIEAGTIYRYPLTSGTFAENQSTFSPARTRELPDEGVRGYVDNGTGNRKMPGAAKPYISNDEQKFDYNSFQNAFVAQFIPASDIDDQGRTNPFTLMRVQAKEKGTGKTISTVDAVYTTASETRCRECHLPGGVGADEDTWRTPVTVAELKDLTDPTKPGPATGAGRNGSDGKAQISGFDPGTDPNKAWPPAIHNLFNDKIDGNPNFSNLSVTLTGNETNATNIKVDQNGLRTDRVKASRWMKFDTKTDKPTGETSPTKPANAGPEWRLQLQINYAAADKYGDDSWVNQEKAALFNTLIAHDYMVYYGPTPATGATWPASYSTQVADSYADDLGKSRAAPMYFCSGHHQSHLKSDVGITARSYATNRSDYSRAFHAFHAKFQVYKKDVTAAEAVDGLAHKKGDLVRDVRGHPLEFGGRGWDSQLNDDNGVPLSADASGNFTVKSSVAYDAKKNNWRPDLYPQQPATIAELMLPFGKQVPVEENCVKCHTGATEKAYRDVHYSVGLKCDNCHSDMLAVGNTFSNEEYDSNLTGGGAFGADTAEAIEPADYRRPWLDEPDCGSCHIGDSNIKEGDSVGHGTHSHPLKNVFSAGALMQAWSDGDKSGRSVTPMNARFAVMPTLEDRPEKATATAADVTAGVKGLDGKVVVAGQTYYKLVKLSGALYRKSADVHGSGANGVLTCSTCHGGSHAIWPNQEPNANDNQTAKQLQGYDGNIAECSVCHVKDDFKTGLVATDGGSSGLGVGQGVRDGTVVTPASAKAYLAGPHGLHPVGDESWYKHADGAAQNTSSGSHKENLNGGWHNDMAKKPGPDGEDQCAACHGDNHKGTRLSKTLVDRTLTNAAGKPVKVVKGQIIGCDTCHTLAKSFTGSPKPYNAKTAPTGGWPAAQKHMPPTPTSFTTGTGTGGGGGGHGGH
ncbi:MAG: PKD domain-containing protein [Methylococcaceae bacterium]|nr:PKD domain-containing protein [Methylococcaceae bacterium]